MAGSGVSSRAFLLDAINRAPPGALRLVSDPADADVIIFAEWHGDEASPDEISRVLSSDLYRRHRHKIVIHSGKDDPRPLIRGLYPSLSERLCTLLGCVGAPYLQPTNPFIEDAIRAHVVPTALASFVGSCPGKQVRMELLQHAAAWPDIMVSDTHSAYVGSVQNRDTLTHEELKRQFAMDLMQSKFALCPAGTGLSSFRLFEAMQAGRAPVIMADGWAPPPGPDWDAFSIRVKRRDIPQLREILLDREDEWAVLGGRARTAWEQFYGPETMGLTIVGQAYRIVSNPRSTRIAARTYVYGWRTARRAASGLTQKIGRRLKRSLNHQSN